MIKRRKASKSLTCSEKTIGVFGIKAVQIRISVIVLLLATVASSAFAAEGTGGGGDPAAGKAVIESSGCLSCHSVNGNGNGTAGDLALRVFSHQQSPAGTAAAMWNHAPEMWELMRTEGSQVSGVTRTEAEDVFAFFRSARYFDLRGEVIRGKKIFSEKGCASCHQLSSQVASAAAGPPVGEWKTLFDTAAWTSSLWNHAGTMLEDMERSGLDWPILSEQEMVDLLLYLRTSLKRRESINELTLSDASSGEAVFQKRGCAGCHTLGQSSEGKVNLSDTARDARTMSGLAAVMWNHIPQMYGKKAEGNGDLDSLTPNQVASLASFFYFEGAFSEQGNPANGRKVFGKKGCGACHRNGVPELSPAGGERFNSPTMMSSVWTHGPSMLGEMENRSIDWPDFSEREMEDLIAYLNTGRRPQMAAKPSLAESTETVAAGR
jgi:cytochrome c551/c552